MEQSQINALFNKPLTKDERNNLVNALHVRMFTYIRKEKLPLSVTQHYLEKNGNDMVVASRELYNDYKLCLQTLIDIIVYIEMTYGDITLGSIFEAHNENVKRRNLRKCPLYLYFDGDNIQLHMFDGTMSIYIPMYLLNPQPTQKRTEIPQTRVDTDWQKALTPNCTPV